ncbi:hypothetical protein [Methylococcus geothermalis]|uniref:Uncharacterized protein n=1 Tax=Methylococcus geothermalis TaxID=2681310 RepID=A0A858Q9A9_9GAMM|nr:hypothetical protein [Methylococcus geothermalis]QJD30427.1 hypothetical protein GNH96_10880 [Methylococcus geothermalis]
MGEARAGAGFSPWLIRDDRFLMPWPATRLKHALSLRRCRAIPRNFNQDVKAIVNCSNELLRLVATGYFRGTKRTSLGEAMKGAMPPSYPAVFYNFPSMKSTTPGMPSAGPHQAPTRVATIPAAKIRIPTAWNFPPSFRMGGSLSEPDDSIGFPQLGQRGVCTDIFAPQFAQVPTSIIFLLVL